MTATPEGDQLLGIIRDLVHGRVPLHLEEATTEVVARTLVHIMGDPNLYNHLRVVMDLQRENWNLKQQIIHLQRIISSYGHPVRNGQGPKIAVKKAAPRKKAIVKKAVAKRPPPSNVRAFKRGVAGR